jgi:hypothetical protein
MNSKTQLYGSHHDSPTAVLCSCAPRLAALEAEVADLKSIVHKQHTPTINEHDDRLDEVEGHQEKTDARVTSVEGQVSRLNALFTIVGTVDENVRLLLKANGITPVPKPTPRER